MYPPSVYKFGVASLPVGLLSVEQRFAGRQRRFATWPTSPSASRLRIFPAFPSAPRSAGKSARSPCSSISSGCSPAGISPSEVVKAINAQSAIIPAGDIKIGDLDYYVYSNSLIDVVDKINDIPIKIVNGTPVLVRDIGTAADSAAVQTSIVRVNGREATYIPITRQEGANTLEVTDGIRAKLPKLTEIPATPR